VGDACSPSGRAWDSTRRSRRARCDWSRGGATTETRKWKGRSRIERPARTDAEKTPRAI